MIPIAELVLAALRRAARLEREIHLLLAKGPYYDAEHVILSARVRALTREAEVLLAEAELTKKLRD